MHFEAYKKTLERRNEFALKEMNEINTIKSALVKKEKDAKIIENESHPAHRPASIAIGHYAKHLNQGRSVMNQMSDDERKSLPTISKVKM